MIPFSFYKRTYSPKTPLQLLNEKLHIYRKDDKEYSKILQNAIEQCLLKLKYNDTVSLDLSDKTKYSYVHIKEELIPNVIDIKLYLGIDENFYNDEIDGYNVSYSIDGSNYNINEIPLYFKFLNSEKHAMSIVIKIAKQMENKIDKLIGVIQHEIIHMLQTTNNEIIGLKGGDCFTVASVICNYWKLPFINELVLEHYMNKTYLTNKELLHIYTGIIYFLNESELCAWKETFNLQSIMLLKRFIKDKKYKILAHIKSVDTYFIYSSLLYFLKEYKHNIISEILNYPDVNITDTLAGFKNRNFNRVSYDKKFDYWISKCTEFLNDVEKIHVNNKKNLGIE